MRNIPAWLLVVLALTGCGAGPVHIPSYREGVIKTPPQDDPEVHVIVSSRPRAEIVAFYDGHLQRGWTREVKSDRTTTVWTHDADHATVLILEEPGDTRIFLKIPLGTAILDP